MDSVLTGLSGVLVLIAAILAGLNVSIALGVTGAVGLALLAGMAPATATLSTVFYSVVHSFHFSVVPMFLLMGYFAMRAGIGQDLFEAATKWLQRLPGGLAIASTCATAAFGAASGSSVGTTTLFTKLALPEMLSRGYDKRLSSASIAISGTLAVLIPPSGLMVIYGILTGSSIGQLLIAGVIPGIVFTLLICLTTFFVVLRNPALAPRIDRRYSLGDRLWSLRLAGPLILITGLIMAGLYTGVFTPTEAGAIGAVATLFLALVRQRSFRGIQLPTVLRETVETSAMIFAIIITALIFSRFLQYSGLTTVLSDFLVDANVSRWVVLVLVTCIYLVLGMLMDAPALLAVTLPITHPVLLELGFDPIWIGVYVVVLVEIGAITPPVGIMCFVVKGAAGDLVRLEDVFRGIIPYFLVCILMLVLLCVFPDMALYLPRSMASQ